MSGTITRTVVLDEFDNPTKDYISEAVHESLTELFQDERVEIHSFDWSIKVNVRYGEE
tara:strand:- start:334 stop:507 length:174 start_codon:yes stop_codon:yes gene_type:complete